MLVVGLLAIVMLLALPAFQNLLQGTVQREVNRLAGVIRLLRNEAVLTNSRFRLVLELSEGGYRVEERDAFGDYALREHPDELRPHRFAPGLEVQDVLLLGRVLRADREDTVPIVVDASGYVDPFVLHFTEDGEPYTLRVEGFTGRVSLERGHAEE